MNRRNASAGLLAMFLGGRSASIVGSLVGSAAGTGSAAAGATAFPLVVSRDKRYLQDSAGLPFLMTGDAAWSLIAELKHDEAKHYLSTRRRQGFNTLLVNLVEHKFSSNAPANTYGVRPFHAQGDFSRPNDRYFDEARWILERAAELGFLVLLAPAYLGSGGGPEGWYAEMKAAGTDALREYGRYVARRFGDLDNIIWVHGGDFNDPDRSMANAMVAGISEIEPGALHTVHGAPETVTADYWQGESWLCMDTVYTYGDVFQAVSSEYRRRLPLPVLMIESNYEYEHGADEQAVRAQAYGAILGGAAGQVYGAGPVWHFSGPGLFSSSAGWRKAVGSPGALSMGHLSAFFETIEWWKIAPDEGAVLIDAAGGQDAYAICGSASDGSFAVIYASRLQHLTMRPPWPASGKTDARWYDPAAGIFLENAASVEESSQALVVATPRRPNANGFDDWLLFARRDS